MIYCTTCGQQNEDAARVCMNCGAPFTGQKSSTPFTTGDATNTGTQPPGGPWATPQYGGTPQAMQTGYGGGLQVVGAKREPAMVIVFTLVTCFIYLFYWWYITSAEIKNALGRQDINPALDIVLGILTCGIYFIYLAYRNPQLMLEMQDRVGLPRNDISIISLILYLVFAPVTSFLIQSELNKIWDAAGRR